MITDKTTFATALNCIDGRVQLPVNEAVSSFFDVACVDTITAAGIVRYLSDETGTPHTEASLSCVRISLESHGSRGIAVAAHTDCSGNAVGDRTQQAQLRRAVAFISEQFPGVRVIAIWVGLEGTAEILAAADAMPRGQETTVGL